MESSVASSAASTQNAPRPTARRRDERLPGRRDGKHRRVQMGLVIALALGTLPRCDCEETTFNPGATYTPDKNLAFGPVSVTSEKRLELRVLSSGSAGLKLLSTTVENASDARKWKVVVAEPLLEGLSPGRTSSISVTYRPCPDAWETVSVVDPATNMPKMVERVRAGFDFSTCPLGASDAADLVTVEENTRAGGARIGLSGEAVLPPNASVSCQREPSTCNMPMGAVPSDTCFGMAFGPITGGETPCDLVVEVKNTFRNGRAVGELAIEGIEITVQDIDRDPPATVRGEEVGFTVHDLDGSRLDVNAGAPLLVPIPTGATSGARRFLIRYAGTASGVFDGRPAREMTGVKIYTSDPDHPVLTFGVSGTGSAPDIRWTPPALVFGPVDQGTTKTLTATITSSGDADLRITSIALERDPASSPYRFTTDRGTDFPIVLSPSERLAVRVEYAPRAAGEDANALLIGNNDPKTMNQVRIPISGGALPKIRVDPPESLEFSTGASERAEQVLLSNVGFGDLRIIRLRISGPMDDMNHPSVDDFSFAGCSNPCEPNMVLCAPATPGCTSSRTAINLVYQNNDVSTVDIAELHITTNDPVDPERSIFLEARDTPCLRPIPVIQVETARPCKGSVVRVSGATSQPGGPLGGSAALSRYDWQWIFSPATPPTITPNMSATATAEFVPTDSGTYVLGLTVSNDCGRTSQAPASETINVAETCAE